MEEFENAGMGEQANVETANTDVNDVVTEKEQVEQPTEVERTFTQKQVNDFVKYRIERERNSVWKRYGVENRDGLDDLINKSHSYDVMKEEYDNIVKRNQSLEQELAFIRQNIDPSRQDDVLTYFKGKGLEFTEEALAEELRTHPEWLKVVEISDKPNLTFSKIGADRPYTPPKENEKDLVSKLFNLKEIV